jgi:hypothetical protein
VTGGRSRTWISACFNCTYIFQDIISYLSTLNSSLM